MSQALSRINPAPVRLLLAGLVLAVAGSITLTANAAPPDGGGMHRGGGHMMGGHILRLLDSVNATPEQRSQIQQIVGTAHADLRSQRESTRSLHEQASALFTQPTVDARAAEAVRLQLLAQHDQSSKRMLQAMLEVSRVLTPEQRQQIGERMKQRRAMMERHRSERGSLERRQ